MIIFIYFEEISYYEYVYTDKKLYNEFILPRKYTNIIEFVSKNAYQSPPSCVKIN